MRRICRKPERDTLRYTVAIVVGCTIAVMGTAAAASGAMTTSTACPPTAVTFSSMRCRIRELAATTDASSELGNLKARLLATLAKADTAVARGENKCTTDRRRAHAEASADLRAAARWLDHFRRALVTNVGRSLDDTVRDAFLEIVIPLRDDVRAFRRELVCPISPLPTPTATATPTPTATFIPNVCGDGIPITGLGGGPGGEECDDGNRRDGDGCSAQCLLEPTLKDFSGFQTFTFARESGFGFCPPVHALFNAAVTTDQTGAVLLHWSILRDDVGCTPFGGCPNHDDFVRALTPGEVADLRDAFSAVKVHLKNPAGCVSIVFDPCLVNAFQWDQFRAEDFLCEIPFLRSDEVTRILLLLDELTA